MIHMCMTGQVGHYLKKLTEVFVDFLHPLQ